MWEKGLALALGLATAGAASAGEGVPPVATLGRPVATMGRPVAAAPAAAVIGRPMASDGVQQASFLSGQDRVVRGVSPDPLPAARPGAGLVGWKPVSGPALLPAGPPLGGPELSAPSPIASAPSGPIASSPIVAGAGDPCAPAYCPEGACPTDCLGLAAAGGWPSHRWWLSAEYLMWWAKGDNAPPLVSAGPASGGPTAGILPPVGNGQVLYGNAGLGEQLRSGLRLFGGVWLCDQHVWGLEVGAFFLGEKVETFGIGSMGDPVIRRPIIQQTPGSPLFGQESGELVAAPGLLTGRVESRYTSQLWGYEANVKRGLWCGEACSLDFLVGFRNVSLDEGLTVLESLNVLTPNAAGVSFISLRDNFAARNRFYGVNLGVQSEVWLLDRLSMGVTGKVALGSTWQDLQVAGSTTFFNGATNLGTGSGGLLALPTNIGSRSQTRFSVVPEVGLTLNYQVYSWLRLSAGYNFLYWSDVVRPAQQIDRNVNFNHQPVITAAGAVTPGSGVGAAVPMPRFQTTDFWAHGINFGVELRY
jgi:hypothetical protein